MKEDKNKPIPLHKRTHGNDVSEENQSKELNVEDVIKGGQAGSPYYKNMNNETKGEDETDS